MDDFFDVDYDEYNNSESICGLTNTSLQELRAKFENYCSVYKITLSNDLTKIVNGSLNKIVYYRAFSSQIREGLFSLKKTISEYMWKEL